MNVDKPTVNPVVVLREEFDDWAVLFNPDTSAAVGINPAGVEVWKLLDGNHDLPAIVAGIRESFEGVPESVTDDIGAFVADLGTRGFLGGAVDESSASA